jgi:phosphatidylserine/phosphatidylglycerophosphate/cardiolipin synthase-like enzyme
MTIPDDFVAPYGGSLIRHMGKIIAGTREQLLILNPYWSTAGLKILARHLPEEFRVKKARAVVMSPYSMDQACSDGCDYFKWMLKSRGFEVEHWTPKLLKDGKEPLAHAKVIISDERSAYLGSANLSERGLSGSIEIGVHLEGPVAKYLSDWFLSLRIHFEDH